jgi:CO/xanthine dehydrogenase Mo-binding subunit
MNSSGTVANGIGQPVRRKEDFRLLTGSGSFADDVLLPSLAHAVIVRSPHAHAQICFHQHRSGAWLARCARGAYRPATI